MLHLRRILLAFVVSVAGLIGCTADEVGGPDNGAEVPVGEVANSFASCSAGLVALVPGNGISLNELTTLASAFNDQVIDAPGLTTAESNSLRRVEAYSPTGIPSGTLRNITVTKDSTGSGTGWCGVNDGFDDITVEWCSSGGPGDPTALQNRKTTILHELWNIMNPNTNKLSNWGAAAGCSLHPASDPVTTSPCVHEVQFEYDFCGVRPESLTPNVDLFTGVSISGPSSLDEQDSAQYTASFTDTGGGGQQQFVFGNEGPPANRVVHVDAGAMKLVLDPSVAWSSSTHLSLSCSTCNPTVVTGEQAGSGQLAIVLPPAGNVVYPRPNDTRNVAVQVDDPPSTVASVSVTPGLVTLGSANPTQLLTATARDAQGNVVPGVSFTWSTTSWLFLSGTGSTRTVSGCKDGPLPNLGTVTATEVESSVAGNASVLVKKGYPYHC